MNPLSKTLVLKNYASIGLGDRLYCLAMAIAFAKVTGRALSVDWTDGTYAAPGENAFNNLFSLQHWDYHDTKNLNDKDMFPEIWRGKLSTPHPLDVSTLNKDQIDAATLPYEVDYASDYAENVLVWSAAAPYAIMDGFLTERASGDKRLDEREVIRSGIGKHLVINPGIQEYVDDFKQKHFARPVIGVHVRHTKESASLRPRMADFYQRVNGLVEANDNAIVFLATDNTSVQEEFNKRFRSICFTEKTFCEKGAALHHESADKKAHAQAALIDLLLLSSCDYLVHPRRSTFSVMAGHLSNMPASNLIALNSQYELLRNKFSRVPLGARFIDLLFGRR